MKHFSAQSLRTLLLICLMAVGIGNTTVSADVIPQPAAGYYYYETAIEDIKSGDIVLIVNKATPPKAMSNANGASAAPTATKVTIDGDRIASQNQDLEWTVVINSDNTYSFAKDANNYLYTTNTNNGVRVGTNSNNKFVWAIDEEHGGYLRNVATGRYIGCYVSNSDWRCYTSVNTNIQSTKTAFYVRRESVEVRKDFEVSVTDVGWATFASSADFIVNADNEIYYVAAQEESSVTLAALKGGTKVKAGEGILIRGAGKHGFAATTGAGIITDNLLKGTTEAKYLTEGEAYILTQNGDQAEFALCPTGTLAAGKAYLPARNDSKTPTLQLAFNNTTSIHPATEANGYNTKANDPTANGYKQKAISSYNLAGQRTSADYHGIVIINGKKVLR